MSVTDTVYVRELLELTGARDLYEELGVEPDCTRVELVAALEKRRDWARRFPDDPVARWWTRHMVRTARLLVHDDARPKRKQRQDDLQAAIKGAVLQGSLGPEMRRLVNRMGERRGFDVAQVDAMIDHERKALEDLQKKIRTALGKGDDEAREAIRAAMWGAMVAGNVSATVIGKIVERGSALGLDVETVRKVLDEVKAEWKVERDEALDTDLQGRWVPPHRRVQRDDAHRTAASAGGGKWTLADSLEDGLDDIVRGAAEDHDDLPELDLDPSVLGVPEEDPPSQDVSSARHWPPADHDAFADRNAVTGASVVLSVRSVPPSLPNGFLPNGSPSLPPALRRVAEPPSSATLSSSVSRPKPEQADATATRRARMLALHAAFSSMAVIGGALYGVTWFLLANRTHLF